MRFFSGKMQTDALHIVFNFSRCSFKPVEICSIYVISSGEIKHLADAQIDSCDDT